MEVALTDPEHGYYAVGTDRPTRSGDFLTAPELHPIFGATLGRAIEDQWQAIGRPDPFEVIEFGAGSGRLAIDILAGLRDRSADLLDAIRYRPIEIVPAKTAAIAERLASAGFERRIVAPSAREEPNVTETVGMVLANEFLDALPVHRVEQTGRGLVEQLVGWSDGQQSFVDVGGPPSTPALAARLASEGIDLEPGQRAEICLALDGWADDLSAAVGRGVALVIDYGDDAPGLYGRTRRRGTLLAYAGHRAHEDVLAAVGSQDITAHVDFTAVTTAVERRGWRRLGLASQGSFLAANGLQAELEARRNDPATTTEDYLGLRAALGRLLDPQALGGFRVLGLARGIREGVAIRGF